MNPFEQHQHTCRDHIQKLCPKNGLEWPRSPRPHPEKSTVVLPEKPAPQLGGPGPGRGRKTEPHLLEHQHSRWNRNDTSQKVKPSCSDPARVLRGCRQEPAGTPTGLSLLWGQRYFDLVCKNGLCNVRRVFFSFCDEAGFLPWGKEGGQASADSTCF